ncbi:ATP-dependent nuclease [Aggregatibacter actinomycetemcomitans]|nr:ATP-dependent endonuclease [Aggregatibacter actinomycetemcomitans]
MDRYKSIYIIKKENEEFGSKVTQCEDDLFDGNEQENWNLSYWINPDRSELFFAEKVILVEGATDKIIIPALAKQLGIFRHGYTVIDCGSKGNIPLYLKLLNKFKIKYITIYDQDHQDRKSENDKAVATKLTNKILSSIEEELGHSIMLINDIEEELGYECGKSGKPFQALQYIKSDSFKLSPSFEEKIRKIYQ